MACDKMRFVNNLANHCLTIAFCQRLVMVMAFLSLANCAMKEFNIENALSDHTLMIEGTPAAQQFEKDKEKLSDQLTIRNVVSGFDSTKWGEKPIPWVNPDTGSQGTITTVAETKNTNGLCRKFQTSREAFDGIALYRGETCLENGFWVLKSFVLL